MIPRKSSLAFLCLWLVACAAPQYQAEQATEEGRLGDAVAILEKWRDENPGSYDARMELAWAYYRIARKSLDEKDETRYVNFLAGSMREAVRAAEIEPRRPEPHTLMGIVSAYRGDLDATLTNLRNAQRLAPESPVALTNLAEVHIYRGELGAAATRLERARKLGAPRAYVEMNEVLAAWRRGDYIEARDTFAVAYDLNPEVVRVWNEAPVSDPIESFEDFTKFCCAHIACGPFMANACADMKLQVAERELSEETLRKELAAEMERRRALRQIYEKQRELEIEVDPEGDGP